MRRNSVVQPSAILLFASALCAPAHAETGRLPTGVTPLAYDITVAPDATKLTFSGEETITVDVSVPTRILTLNAADLAIGSAALDGAAQGTVKIDASSQTASFTFPQPVTKGRHSLKLAWSGKINQSAAGPSRPIVHKFLPAVPLHPVTEREHRCPPACPIQSAVPSLTSILRTREAKPPSH